MWIQNIDDFGKYSVIVDSDNANSGESDIAGKFELTREPDSHAVGLMAKGLTGKQCTKGNSSKVDSEANGPEKLRRRWNREGKKEGMKKKEQENGQDPEEDGERRKRSREGGAHRKAGRDRRDENEGGGRGGEHEHRQAGRDRRDEDEGGRKEE